MGRKRREFLFYGVTVASCMVAMIVVIVAALLVYDRIKEKAAEETLQQVAQLETTYDQAQVDAMMSEAVGNAKLQGQVSGYSELLEKIRQGLSTGETILGTLRPLYPEQILVASGGVYHFVPIRQELKMHGRKQENLRVLENGELQYLENNQVISRKGIDVSKYQGEIEWKKVAEAGVEYAFIRVGIRGYGAEGNIALDDMFAKNVQGAKQAGIKVGVYFFTQALTVEEAKEEAAIVLEQIAPYEIDYPVVCDVEKVSAQGARMNALTAAQRTDVVIAFLEEIRAAGYTPMVYANLEMFAVMLEIQRLEAYEKWYANFGTEMYFPYDYAVWQYSETGTVPGIEGDVDLNISFKEW